jgi:hypothetical protein
VEGHGKGPLDQHFSGVAYTIMLASLDKQLTCSKDIINAINERQSSINNHRCQKINKINYNYGKKFVLNLFHSCSIYVLSRFVLRRTV